ncbi:DNA topology modulation protein FlaR [Amycolatopsis mongoliensis]|uniref:DNA topology modulation protein FlaR n=1 Tax=Amycolatopsis mongoliensis TaxID=715475 RepID=A0A9Y2JJT5_9PSEU|nr:DNA topology modulation protein FlaR [Amycolatopsis sp. 4-36]WIX99824.1 DNA topology modulation protein FlaR [Amycolatopsis sp. 4-36]
MERVLVLGCGGAGKSTFARRLGARTGLPVVELDSVFWPVGWSRVDWGVRQRELVAGPKWILDGDLGPYDALEVRAAAADTAVLLNPSPLRCAWRALRRGRERWDFWSWLLTYRWRHLPEVRRVLAVSDVDVVELRSPRAVRVFLSRAGRGL